MSKEEVIRQFCKLSTEVAEEVYGGGKYAHDCFCADGKSDWEALFQFDPEVLKYIVEIVRKNI